MGQGVMTGLAMLVAEEARLRLGQGAAEFAASARQSRARRVWGDMSTGGSRSIRNSQEMLRKAGATRTRDADRRGRREMGRGTRRMPGARSVITHAASGRTVRYARSRVRQAAGVPPPRTSKLKDAKDWSFTASRR